MKINNVTVYKTIDQCVEYIISLGIIWDHKKEMKLKKDRCFVVGATLVLYDKYDLLA